jgi:tetratricopeptide (TPR) repeat protein
MEDYNQDLSNDVYDDGLEYQLAYFTKAILEDKNNANAYKERASVRNLLGDYQGAMEDYNQAIRINPKDDGAYSLRSFERYNLGDYKGAIDDCNKAIDINPNDAQSYSFRAEFNNLVCNYQAAIEDADKSIQLEPDYPSNYYLRGKARSGLEDYEGAIQDYELAIQLTPKRDHCYYKQEFLYSDLGYARYKLGNYISAIEDYNKAIPNDGILFHHRQYGNYNLRGNCRFFLGDLEGAIKDYNQAIKCNFSDFENAILYINRGNAYNDLKNYQKAIEDYNEAIKIAEQYPDVYEYRGVARYKSGDKQGGIEDIEKAATLYKQGGWVEYYQEALNIIKSFDVAEQDAILEDIQEISETANGSLVEVESINKSSAKLPLLNKGIGDTNKENSQKISEKLNQSHLTEIKELTAAIDADNFFYPKSVKEAKDRITVSIARRQGQPQFRQSLLEVYNYRCSITGCDAQEALEAAHIIPYKETENNHPSNGLLLRADIHTLFDLNLITINPDTMQLHIAPSLQRTSYGEIDGKYLQLPIISSYMPKKDALKWRCNQCEWFTK